MPSLEVLRQAIRANTLASEDSLARRLLGEVALDAQTRRAITERAIHLIGAIRGKRHKGVIETFLVEYGLSNGEGVALMCLAEALLRVPDAETATTLIEDKLAPADWGSHFGKSASPLVNSATLGLVLTGGVLNDAAPGLAGTLRGMIKRLGEPVIRGAVTQVMREMGRQFVLGRTITEAMSGAAEQEARGYTYSYDMLGEAAVTEADAQRHYHRYAAAITAIAGKCTHRSVHENPGISIKLSALFPRYELNQKARVMDVLVPRVQALSEKAAQANMGLAIDAEEADRLDLSLDVIETLVSAPSLSAWEGFGVVVQTYSRRASAVIDWLYALAGAHDRRITVRVAKGAYWDSEIKNAQVLGIDGYPVFTRKAVTDLAYVAMARKLFAMADRIYPQFATHNAQTIASILELAGASTRFEFQRLHGMGQSLHDIVRQSEGTACRIYAPVGAHSDLLAYLVRRLLENGANSSFVNQIVDDHVPAEIVAADPVTRLEEALAKGTLSSRLPLPRDLFAPERVNSKGYNLNDPVERDRYESARAAYRNTQWHAVPLIADRPASSGARLRIENPANADDTPGFVVEAGRADIEAALTAAAVWSSPASERAETLGRAADLYEEHAGEFFALAAREAGKSAPDAIAELREAVDFLRYYAGGAEALTASARGIFACISPWNFPLAIFTGQVAAALAAGNGVIAKPAESTPLIAARAVTLMHDAGVPSQVLQFLPGGGAEVGGALTSDARINAVCFTGSLPTAQRINRAMADHLAPEATLIAETGGINAMIVDSTALPEQAVEDIVASAFQSTGQRCSALRVLYVQEDIAPDLLGMLYGAMDALVLGDPWDLSTDIGPLIDAGALKKIGAYVDAARRSGRVLHQMATPHGLNGHFLAPVAISVPGIEELTEEIFGPVLHVATFRPTDLPAIVAAINSSGYGLTFGLHTRIDQRAETLISRLRVGNAYVNRNQIGAIVGSQPFGGEGLSGTGPKAGGPNYLPRFTRPVVERRDCAFLLDALPLDPVTLAAGVAGAPRPAVGEALARIDMPGVTGETNRLGIYPRGLVLCVGPGLDAARQQAAQASREGCTTVTVAPGGDIDGVLQPETLVTLAASFDAVMFWGPEAEARALRRALARREGVLVPLILEADDPARLHAERHVCINTTASGGNAALLAAMAED